MKKRPTALSVRTKRNRRLSYDNLENRQLLAADLLPVNTQTCEHPEVLSSKRDLPETSPVTNVIVGDGTDNRSNVRTLTVEFEGFVEPEDGAFSMVNRETGDRVALAWRLNNSGSFSRVFIQFTGDQTTNGGSLVDGNYELTVHGDLLGGSTSAADFVFGDMEDDNLYRYFGDTGGDRHVDVRELLQFRNAYLTSKADPDFDLRFDSNGDETINIFDLLEFRRNYNESLDWKN